MCAGAGCWCPHLTFLDDGCVADLLLAGDTAAFHAAVERVSGDEAAEREFAATLRFASRWAGHLGSVGRRFGPPIVVPNPR